MKKDGIKNHTCYYFHDMIKIENFDFGILLDEKSFNLWHFVQNFNCCQTLHIIYSEVDGSMKDYDGTKYLVLFGSEKYGVIYYRIRYLIGLKSSITCFFS